MHSQTPISKSHGPDQQKLDELTETPTMTVSNVFRNITWTGSIGLVIADWN